MKLDTMHIFGTDIDVTTVRTLEEVESICDEWDWIQHNEPLPIPNADARRYAAGLRALGHEAQPHILLVKSDGQPAAMVIGRIERHPVVFRLGYKTMSRSTLKCLSIVYGGVIGRPTKGLCVLLLSELTSVLRRREADMVFFNHLRTDSPMFQLCETVPHFITRGRCVSVQSHWQTGIPKTVDEFYSRISKSRRQRWHRDVKNLEKMSSSGIQMVCYRDLDDIERLIDEVCHIEKSTYKNGLEIGFTDSALNRALLEQAAIDGWLRAYVLYVSGEPCAFQLDIHYGRTQFTEYGSFDPRWERGSPGIVLLIKVLEELCRDPETDTMDYGFGDALYKEKFGTTCWPEKSVYIYAPRPGPVLVNIATSANLAFCQALHRAAACVHFDSSIKRRWRRLARRNGQTQDAVKRVN